MKIIVMSRKMAENQKIKDEIKNKKIVAISVNSSGGEPAKLPYCSEICQLTFDDVSTKNIPGTIPFANIHAYEIISFMERNLDADFLLVHCDAGVSRSPAIASAIAEYYFNDHEFYLSYPCYNRMVYFILRHRMEDKETGECS